MMEKKKTNNEKNYLNRKENIFRTSEKIDWKICNFSHHLPQSESVTINFHPTRNKNRKQWNVENDKKLI